MGLIEHLVASIEPCAQAGECLNSPEHRGEQAQCMYCRLAQSGGGNLNCWKPWTPGTPHPELVAEKKQKSKDRVDAAVAKRKGKSRPKQALYRKAARAEKKTESNFNSMAATKNSGRSNKDGDHVQGGRVTFDTKLQSGNINPVVRLDELDKVRNDARRAGNPVGALVLRNKFDRGVVVLDEADYMLLFTSVVRSMAQELVNAVV